jgi:heme-degrading monooxygenase HmoA
MHARVNYRQIPPGKMDEAIRIYRDQTLPDRRGQKGFKAGYVLTNRRTGKLIAIALWDTEADMRASQPPNYADAVAGPAVREEYEVSLRARPSPRRAASRRAR